MNDSQLPIYAMTAVLGGTLSLGGVFVTLRHQRRLATVTWRRDQIAGAVSNLMAALNAFSRSVGDESWTFDGRFVESANSVDSLWILVESDQMCSSLRLIETELRALHNWRNSGHSELPIGSEDYGEWWALLNSLWIAMKGLRDATRKELAKTLDREFTHSNSDQTGSPWVSWRLFLLVSIESIAVPLKWWRRIPVSGLQGSLGD